MSASTTLAPHLDTHRFADVFEGSPMSVLVTLPAIAGRDQRIVYVNPAFERMTGWSRKAITGLTPAVLQGPDTDHRIFQDLKAKLARGDAWRGATVNYRRDGQPFDMEWSISAVRGPAGDIAAFLAVQEDVTDRRRTERALQESEGRYRAIFEQSFQLVGVLSPDGIVQEVNETALRFGKIPRSEVIGRPFWETPWWQACQQSRARLREAVASAAAGTLVQFRAQCFGPTRAIHTLDVSIKPVRDSDGRIVLLVPEGRDITQMTEQKARLRRETARLQNAQRIGRMGSWDYDVATGRIHIHEQALELFGLPATFATLTAAEFEAIVHPDDRASRREALADAIAHATRYDTTYRITTPGGSFVINVVGEPVRGSDGKLTGLIGVVQDISERDRVERELIAARKAAEAASEAKSRFLATMGHELRTPLNAINGFSEIMAAETRGPLGDDAYRDYTRHILASGRHLLDLINNVLDLTRLELNAVPADVDPIDVNGLIHSVTGQMQAQAAQKQIDLAVRATMPALLRADPRLLRQVLFNLIGNAVKFAPPATRIDVVGEGTDAGEFALRVGDAGPGIAEEDLERVVQPFQQADDGLARQHEGLGLGLYVVRTIAEGHGACLTFDRSPQGGSEVGLLFPPQRVVKN
jgi:PAS domain S-box-containing protein